MNKERRIIDQRNKEKFQMDDMYLNGYARHCGIYATGVYVSLCRHANRDQYCFPSFKLIAEELAISEKSVQRAVVVLVEWNIIELIRSKKPDGTWQNNIYQTMAEDHARKSVGECHPYREFEGMQPSR